MSEHLIQLTIPTSTNHDVIDLTDDTPDSSLDESSTGDILSSDESSSAVTSYVPGNISIKLETNKKSPPHEENSQNSIISKKKIKTRFQQDSSTK